MDLLPSLANEKEMEVCALCGFCGNVFFTDKRTHDKEPFPHSKPGKVTIETKLKKKANILGMAGWKDRQVPVSR